MRPVHDIDVVILMATTLASKRRPAELIEIVAAADLIQGFIPFVEKLGEAILRLSTYGLISETETGFTLTPVALAIMGKQPKKSVNEDLIISIKLDLAAYTPKGEFPAIRLSNEQLSAAIRTQVAAKNTTGKNLLMPKPKLDSHFKVDGRWRRVSATSKVKS